MTGEFIHPAIAEASADAAYVRGLRNAAHWLAGFDQPLTGFDQDTCRRLARGVAAMADSAANRLGAEPSAEDATPDDKAATVAAWKDPR